MACRTHNIPQISGGQQVKESCEVQEQDHNNGHMTGEPVDLVGAVLERGERRRHEGAHRSMHMQLAC